MLPRTASRLSTILFAISTLIYVNACGDSSTPITGGLGTGGTGGVAAVQVVDEIVAQGLTIRVQRRSLCVLCALGVESL